MKHVLEQSDRSILNFRPEIDFVEPQLDAGMPEGKPFPKAPSDIKDEWTTLANKALACKLLAEVFQVRIDGKVGDFSISLDKDLDHHIIAALNRKYPGAGDKITYAQYKECREAMKDRGDEAARQMYPDREEMKKIRANPNQMVTMWPDTPEGKTGLERPDRGQPQIVKPLNMEDLQKILLKQLMNLLWKNFIKPIFKPLEPMGVPIPDEIA